ncbi:MAG: hypothetical protein OXD30_01580, partial [Bryobacterales bacterium]|nr:hypothetical protein [Bryobacterales bacterium]
MRNLNREPWRSLRALLDQVSTARDLRGLPYRLPTGVDVANRRAACQRLGTPASRNLRITRQLLAQVYYLYYKFLVIRGLLPKYPAR